MQTSTPPQKVAPATDFRPLPLAWLIAWLMERRHPKPQPVEEPFEEHINGLA
jgi:hypothetical protein